MIFQMFNWKPFTVPKFFDLTLIGEPRTLFPDLWFGGESKVRTEKNSVITWNAGKFCFWKRFKKAEREFQTDILKSFCEWLALSNSILDSLWIKRNQVYVLHIHTVSHKQGICWMSYVYVCCLFTIKLEKVYF